MEKGKTTYRFVVNNENEEIEVDEAVIGYLATMKNMIDDLVGMDMPVIPLTGEYTTTMMKQIIGFYVAIENEKKKKKNKKQDVEKAIREQKEVLSYLASEELIALAKTANFLDAKEFLDVVIDLLREPLLEKSTEALRIDAEWSFSMKNQDGKRRSDTGLWGDDLLWKNTRLQYRREVFIQRIMAKNLGDIDAGPRIDQRIRRFAEPLLGNLDMDTLLVRHIAKQKEDESVFLSIGSEIREYFMRPGSALSLSRGIRALNRESFNEVLVDETYFVVLDDTGKLAIYGECRTEAAMHEYEAFLEKAQCIAAWSLSGKVFVLTNKALFLITPDDDDDVHEINLGSIPASSILEVYVKNDGYGEGALFLTREGYLYAWEKPDCSDSEDSSSDSELACFFPELAEIRAERAVNIFKLDVNGLRVKLVCVSDGAKFVVASDGRLYVNGKGGNFGELGLGETTNTGGKWLLVDLPYKEIDDVGGIRLIYNVTKNDRGVTVFVAGNNHIYMTNDDTSLFQRLKLKGGGGDIGAVVSILFYKEDTLLVATTTGLYLIGATNDSEECRHLGGSDSNDEPLKLNIPYNGAAFLIDNVVSTNKKARLDCSVCFAYAEFAYKHIHAVCSPYCARKIASARLSNE